MNQNNHLQRHGKTKKHIKNLKEASENEKMLLSDFISEYKLLESKANNKHYEHFFEIKNVEQFWHKIGNLKNSLDEPLFPNLYKLAVHVLTLPHSSACAERIFSKLALIKNKLTNKLKVTTCNSMLSALNLIDKDIEDWIPCDELIFKYRNEMSKSSI